jgi:hypothetical protein
VIQLTARSINCILSEIGDELLSPALTVNGTDEGKNGLNPARRKPAIRDPLQTL